MTNRSIVVARAAGVAVQSNLNNNSIPRNGGVVTRHTRNRGAAGG